MRCGSFALLLLACSLVALTLSFPLTVKATIPSITRVQGPAFGVSSSGTDSTVSATMTDTPTVGNYLIAGIGFTAGSNIISSITEVGVSWSAGILNVGNMNTAIWVGNVTAAGAAKTVLVTFDSDVGSATLTVCEYSGLNVTSLYDKTAHSEHAGPSTVATTSSGSTAQTQPNELCVAAIAVYGAFTQSAPQNGYTLVKDLTSGGADTNDLAYLEKITPNTGEVGVTGTTISTPTQVYVGCIVAFRGYDLPYTYTLRGPYLETGEVFNGFVNITFAFESIAPQQAILNGSSGSAQTLIYGASEPAVNVFWNITADHTRQRTFMIDPDTTDIYIYVPNPSTDTVYQYSISVTSFAQLNNAYVAMLKNVAGTNRVVEQQKYDPNNAIPFWLIFYNDYALRVTSDNGTFTWAMPADTQTTKQYTITQDMINEQYSGFNVTYSATRSSTTDIDVSFVDPNATTTWIYTQIYHWDSGTLVSDFVQNDTASSQTIAWSSGEAVDYYVNTTALKGGETLIWFTALPVVQAYANWSTYLNILGTLTGIGGQVVPISYAAGWFIVLALFSVGSYRDTEAYCFIAIIVAALLTFIGWMQVPVMGLVTGGLVVVFMVMHRGKQENPQIG